MAKPKELRELPTLRGELYIPFVGAIIEREAEESGLDITFINGEDKRVNYPNRDDVSSLIEPNFFVKSL